MTRYYTLPKSAYQPSPADAVFDNWSAAHLGGQTVFEPEERHVHSGLLNADGDPLYRAAMQPIGFIHHKEDE